jgi:hypothetical protein
VRVMDLNKNTPDEPRLPKNSMKPLGFGMVGREGFEPPTFPM